MHQDLAQKLERLERMAGTLTDLHLHYAEESRRYADMLNELVQLRVEILGRPPDMREEVAQLIAESVRATPPAPGAREVGVDHELLEMEKPKGRRASRHSFPNYRQVG